jgi:phosphoglycolate phosphatase
MVLLSLRGTVLPCGNGTLEAVLFDKDGTISHSEPMLIALAQARVFHCLELAGLAVQSPDRHRNLADLLHRAYGLSSDGVHPAGTMAVASRDHNLVATATALAQVGLGWPEALAMAEAVFARTDAIHGQGSERRPAPTPGLVPLLEALHQAGVRCAVISNDHVEGIEAFLSAHGLEPYVQALWSAEHRPRKPDPAAVHGLCCQLGVAVQHCALIGDANSDLRMARAAGVPVVLGYRAGWQRPVELDDAFLQLDHWEELAVVPGAPGTAP